MDETTTTYETTPEPAHSIVLTQEAQYYLNEGAGWAKFLGIIGFIFCGLMIIAALAIGLLASRLPENNSYPNQIPNALWPVLALFYGLIAFLYIFPSLYLYQFGDKTKKGMLYNEEETITGALEKLKSFLKFWGIYFIVVFSIMLIMLFFPLVFSLLRH